MSKMPPVKENIRTSLRVLAIMALTCYYQIGVMPGTAGTVNGGISKLCRAVNQTARLYFVCDTSTFGDSRKISAGIAGNGFDVSTLSKRSSLLPSSSIRS